MFWLIALVAVVIIVLVALIVLTVRRGGISIKDLLTILGMVWAASAIVYIAIWTLVYGILENLS